MSKISEHFAELKGYEDFENFIERNGVEVLSFSDGVAARFKTFRSYKRGVQRISETSVEQVVGKDYEELSQLLNKRLKKLVKFPLLFFLGSIMCVISVVMGFSSENSVFIVFGLLIGIPAIYFSIYETIRFVNGRKVLSKREQITKDRIVFNGLAGYTLSLFSDVLHEK